MTKPRILFVSDAALAMLPALDVVPGATLFKFGGSFGPSRAVKFVEATADQALASRAHEVATGGCVVSTFYSRAVWIDGKSVAELFADPERLAVNGTAWLFPRGGGIDGVAAIPFVEVDSSVAAYLRKEHGIGEKLRAGEWVLE